jgi:hypothetical protein
MLKKVLTLLAVGLLKSAVLGSLGQHNQKFEADRTRGDWK